MLPPAFSSEPESNEAREYERLLQHGMLAVKNGNLVLAKKLLDQAAHINSADARIWIWLSATTDDLAQRRSYLENALAVDPANQIAKRGLAVIARQLDHQSAMPGERATTPQTSTGPIQPPLPQESPPPGYEVPSSFELPSSAPEESQAVGLLVPHEALPPLPPEPELPTLEELLSPGPPEVPSSPEPDVKTYTCPNCGNVNTYTAHDTRLVCKYCGFTRKVDEPSEDESSPQAQSEAIPAAPALHWVESQAHLTCEHCGVVILGSPDQPVSSCPYCASTRLVPSPGLVEFIDPQVIDLFTVDPSQAAKSIKAWLGKGFLAPDNLVSHAGMQLHPAYYPFWLLSGTLEVPWFCDVNMGSGNLAKWEAHTGSQSEQLDNTLIPGLRRLSNPDFAAIEPFNLDGLVEFNPDTLAGVATLAYDAPLADASLQVRDMLAKKVQPSITGAVEPGRQKRNFRLGTARWSDLTSKLALLPIYVGNYPFQGKRYRLLINGQTGKVSGQKPLDRLKVILYSATGIILLIVILVLIWLLSR